MERTLRGAMKVKRLRNVPWVSGMLVVINVIVFLMCTFSGNVLYNKGELDVVSVLAGKQYGRLLWAMFLHAGIEHIFNNMVLLLFLGAMIEKVTGHVTFLVLYFLSGIGGNLCSLLVKLLQMDYSASVGASGAIFGLDGVLLAWILLDRQSMPDVTPKRVILMIALSLYSGFTAQRRYERRGTGLCLSRLRHAGQCIRTQRRVKSTLKIVKHRFRRCLHGAV